jgi:gamma-glutamyl hercynylcysteine S-oxide hydrolase
MCRHLAYVGPPIALTKLLHDAPHGLVHQAQHPLHQISGTANPDGYGVAWYEPGDPRPRRHRSTTSIWADDELRTIARWVRAPAVLGAARLASPGSPVEISGNAPFVADRYAFSLNGAVDGWTDGIGPELRALVSPRRAATITGSTDTETLFAITLDRLDQGAPPVDALLSVVALVGSRTTGRLNLLLTDGATVAASASGNSLFALDRAGCVVVASEPLDDDPGWVPVPDRSVLVADATDLNCSPL